MTSLFHLHSIHQPLQFSSALNLSFFILSFFFEKTSYFKTTIKEREKRVQTTTINQILFHRIMSILRL